MPGEHITRDELDTLSHSELNDEFVLDLASRTFDVSVYQVIFAALLIKRGSAYANHIDHMFARFWHTGRVPKDVRRYAIDCLLGRTPMVVDEDATQSKLLA